MSSLSTTNNTTTRNTISTSANMIAPTTTSTVISPPKIGQKKEYASRYKPPAPLTMNEEIINHIDDAINSVINAVKASLSPERCDNDCVGKMFRVEACKPLQAPPPPPLPMSNAPSIITTATPIITAPATVSSTLTNDTITTITSNTQPLATILPVKRRGRSKAGDNSLPDVQPLTQPLPSVASSTQECTLLPKITTTQNVEQEPQQQHQPAVSTDIMTSTIMTISTSTPTVSIKPRSKVARSTVCLIEDISDPVPAINTKISQIIEDKISEKVEILKEVNVEPIARSSTPINIISSPTTTTAITATTTPITVEAVSPIVKNVVEELKTTPTTTPIESKTTTAVTNNNGENVPNNGKKCRRRRKNELAAIVADQLLESFKLDKARRDNLKKLENLAYEKSDDLFMTGMLLMSSTKRSVTLNNSQKQKQQQNDDEEEEDKAQDDKDKKPNEENENINEMENYNNKRTGLRARTTRQSNNNNSNKANNINNKKIEEIAKPKDGRRRAYRRRGKTLDNENIIKLKSSLETFSIGIERQLTEFEAKRERLNDNKSSITSPNNNNNSKIGSIKVKPCSVILRPSILAASIESQPANIMAPLTAENVAKVSSSAAADNGKSSAFSCRDPRLNKNIHKELSETDRQESKADGVDSGEEEDNYLTEIAKNVNEKIMENEDFMFANDDGLLGLDDTQSSHFYSRPPTSMSVRSAPNFDDRSNYGSMCGDDDEITNTEVMDMDLDDDMSVYTTYSQDVGRGGRRRRRRRRSILLTRRPKKRINRDSEAEKFECTLCKKIFFSATSLSKHNMTLAHVSKVSEQEYLLSRASMLEQGGLVAMANELPMSFPKSMNSAKASKAGASRGRAKTPTPTTKTPRGRSKTPTPTTATTAKGRGRAKTPTPTSNTTTTSKGRAKTPTPTSNTTTTSKGRAKTPTPTTSAAKGRAKTPTPTTTSSRGRGKTPTPIQNRNLDNLDQFSATTVITHQDPSPTVVVEKVVAAIVTPPPPAANESHAFGTSPHLTLNPDERLFFECCTILKGTDTPRPSHNTTPATPTKLDEHQFAPTAMVQNTTKKCHSKTSANTFRDPSNYNNKSEIDRMSPNYPGISQLSAVTNTSTFRIKTKAAMKGYENVDMSLPHDLMVMNKPHQHPHQTTCKLTELADIALGSEKTDVLMASRHMRQDSDIMRRGATAMVDVGHKATPDSSTSSKTIMHSSIMQPVVAAPKIVIPERPFKNIGLEEKEPITFQKPRTTSLCLLKSGASSVVGADICLNVATPNDDNNSITTASFSDRDDFDFNSISCDEDDDNVATNKTIGVGNEDQDDSSNCGRVKTPTNSNEHAMLAIPPPGLSESSSSHGKLNHNNNNNNHDHNSESGAAKTFENKSLIMGRIFKNNTTKVPAPSVKPKNALPKADLNQLFDELRGDCQKSTNNNEVNKTSAMPIASAMKSNPEMLENVEKLPKNAFAKKMSPEEKKSMPKKKVTINLPSATTSRANSPTNTVTKKKVGRKPKANKKTVVESPKEKPPKITKTKKAKKQNAKAQDELAMEQLIDEGQRKSKRRCAANSAKKFVETWSSDEYEEFLSTKDVIALIEEKEKQELEKKKKKKVLSKTDEQQDMELNVQAKENYAFATPQATTTTMVNPTIKQKKTKDGKKKKDKKNDEQTKITPTATKEIDDDMPKHNTGSNVQSLWNYNTNNNRKRKHKHGNHGEMELSTASSGIVAAESYIMPMGYNDMIGSATRPCMLITEQQQQQPMQQQLIQQPLQLMNPFGVTTKPTSSSSSKHYHHHKSSGHHSHHHHNHHSHHHKKLHKERKNVKRKIILDSTDSMPIKQIMEPPPLQPPPPITTTTATMSSNYRKRGRKRKCETKAKHSRRKREKRYYWSSSSSTTSSSSSSSSSSMSLSSSASESDTSDSASDDSDIDDDANEYAVVGTTNDHVIHPAKLSYQPQQQYAATNTATTTTTSSYGNGEHMQKHGWIVGDSHKKLVTMLAIAKGSNKNNNNNGSSSGSSTVSPKKVTKKKNSKKKMRQD